MLEGSEERRPRRLATKRGRAISVNREQFWSTHLQAVEWRAPSIANENQPPHLSLMIPPDSSSPRSFRRALAESDALDAAGRRLQDGSPLLCDDFDCLIATNEFDTSPHDDPFPDPDTLRSPFRRSD